MFIIITSQKTIFYVHVCCLFGVISVCFVSMHYCRKHQDSDKRFVLTFAAKKSTNSTEQRELFVAVAAVLARYYYIGLSVALKID